MSAPVEPGIDAAIRNTDDDRPLLLIGVDPGTGAAAGAWAARIFGFIALILASVNIFGGFAVTQRMLSMYKKRERQGDKTHG